ncbi:MAG: hypothetical protein KC621_03630 [Myxococcales bacterium]|nr:hypothetical protein [Myxococcales bacterium]
MELSYTTEIVGRADRPPDLAFAWIIPGMRSNQWWGLDPWHEPLSFYNVLMPNVPEGPFYDVPLPGRLLRYRSTDRTSLPTPGMYEYAYDSMGRIQEIRGPGRLDRWRFDERGRFLGWEYYDDQGLISTTAPYHRQTAYEYEGDSTVAHLVRYFDDEILTGEQHYDIEDDRVMAVNRGEPWQETYGYDAAGNHVRSFEWTLTVGGLPTFAYLAWYDDPVNPTLRTKERRADLGAVTWGLDWWYDEHGRPIRLVQGDDVETWTYGGPGGTDAWYYGGAGLTAWESAHPWFGVTARTRFEYDDEGRPVLWVTEHPGSYTDTVTAVYVEGMDCDSDVPSGLDGSDGR